MDIGKKQRVIVVEPLRQPTAPAKTPTPRPAPSREPAPTRRP